MKDKATKNKVKRPIYKRWWFWVIIVVILSAIFGTSGAKDGIEDGAKDTINSAEQQTEEKQETETKSGTLPILIDGSCRALTKKFIEGAVKEEYSMFAYNVEEFELDENENGTIKILYLPSNAGDGATKVNLTISLKDGVYKIEYAMLSGMYEVDLTQVSKKYTELITSN